jgi:hypothetical protein
VVWPTPWQPIISDDGISHGCGEWSRSRTATTVGGWLDHGGKPH